MSKILTSPVLAAIRSLSPAYLILLSLSFSGPLLYLATPLYMQQISDRVIGSRNMTTLYALTFIALFLLGMFAVLDVVRTKTLRRVGVAIDERLSRVVFDAFYRQRSGGRSLTVQPLIDLNLVRDVLTGPIVSSFFDALWSPIFIAVMFLIHPVAGIVACVFMALSAGLTYANRVMTAKDGARAQIAAIKANEFGAALIKSSEPAVALGMVPPLRDRWYGLHRAELGWQMAATRRGDIVVGLLRFLRLATAITMMCVGTLLYLSGEIAQGGIIVGFIIMTRALGPIDGVISAWPTIVNFKAALGRLDELLRENPAPGERVPLPAPTGLLAVNRISVMAPGGEKLILNDVAFTVGAGRILAVVGPSGAGKSCLARALVGVWRPVRGSIILGEHDISHWDPDQLGPHLGYLPQEIELVPGSLADNIARFRPKDAPGYAEDLALAAEITEIHDIVRSLPDGFDTPVGVGGHTLSGGQKQRIGLARAVFGRPRLVVLDEPNSNLDAAGEAALTATCDRLREAGTTVVIITHKLNLLAVCDDVLVLNGGAVQGFGTRDQIMARLPRLKASPALTVIEGGEGRRA